VVEQAQDLARQIGDGGEGEVTAAGVVGGGAAQQHAAAAGRGEGEAFLKCARGGRTSVPQGGREVG